MMATTAGAYAAGDDFNPPCDALAWAKLETPAHGGVLGARFCECALPADDSKRVGLAGQLRGDRTGTFGIQDSRENLMYADLAVTILVIGFIGFIMDGICLALIKRFSWHRG